MRLTTWLPALTAVLLNANAFAAPAPATNPAGVYGQDKPYIVVTAATPQFTIKLKSNPTTGYSWFLHEYDANLIAPVKHQFIAPVKGRVGTAGEEMWTFKMKPAAFTVPQQTSIRMIYARPWQGNDSPTQLVFFITTQGK